MNNTSSLHPDTICLHGGQQPDSNTGSMAVPIHQTSSFVFKDTEQAAAMFKLEESGFIYSRLSNPTSEVVEKRVALLEGGVGGLLTASGMAAEMLVLTTFWEKIKVSLMRVATGMRNRQTCTTAKTETSKLKTDSVMSIIPKTLRVKFIRPLSWWIFTLF